LIFSGTIITECESGKKQLEELLHGGVDLQKKFIHQLVLMCEHFGMDGWLINIENKVNTDDVLILRDFVAMLTDAMHDKMPQSQVIWYDSVISSGELKWQNELNSKNRFGTINCQIDTILNRVHFFGRLFFDVCDGIFLNYVWKEENLERSVINAEARALDVFVGVDVFGRNCFGGGGFNSNAVNTLENFRNHFKV
jgi:mannosyl-glycoprotein endo-beta-N-acetylglucosaminidase